MYAVFLSVLLALNVQSTIDSVVVYPDQAMIVRKATVSVSGSSQLAFPELPGVLDDNSVRFHVAGLQIGEVQVKPNYLDEPTPRVRQLEDSLRRLNRQNRSYTDEQAMLAAKQEFLNSVKVGGPDQMSKELATGKVDAGNWTTAINFLGTQMMAISNRLAEIGELQAELVRVTSATEQELDNVRAKVENRKTVLVDVVAPEPGSYEVTLAYRVPGSVSWEPYYELRADPATDNVSLAYYVRMEQSTNEDWNGVRMMLSTARPSAGGVAPEPKPWFVDLAEAVAYTLQFRNKVVYGQNQANMNADETMQQSQTEGWLGNAPAAPPAVTPNDAGISLQYAMPGEITLKSGEDPKKFFLHDEKMPADFSYYVYPRVQAVSYLRAKLQNSSDFVYLRGKANTYVGDEFTGNTEMVNVAPGESANPSFGIDDRMKVHHVRTRLFTSRTGLFGKRTKVDFEFKTTIENYHNKPVTMTLVEQIPTSAHNDVKVSLTKLEPRGAVENKDNGTYTFTFEMKPQEKIIVNIGYAVEYPTSTKIAGLYDAINPARANELDQQYELKMMKK